MRALFKEPRARRKSDFYPTPPEAFAALAHSGVLAGWPLDVWEPACGDGRLSRAIEADGFNVVSTDLLEEYDFGMGGMDFLLFSRPLAPAIITNPPFGLADEFIAQAQKLRVRYLALLLKVDFYNAASRADAFEGNPPRWIMPLTWRLDFTGDGSPPMNCAWYVWTPSATRETQVKLLRKPK